MSQFLFLPLTHHPYGVSGVLRPGQQVHAEQPLGERGRRLLPRDGVEDERGVLPGLHPVAATPVCWLGGLGRARCVALRGWCAAWSCWGCRHSTFQGRTLQQEGRILGGGGNEDGGTKVSRFDWNFLTLALKVLQFRKQPRISMNRMKTDAGIKSENTHILWNGASQNAQLHTQCSHRYAHTSIHENAM